MPDTPHHSTRAPELPGRIDSFLSGGELEEGFLDSIGDALGLGDEPGESTEDRIESLADQGRVGGTTSPAAEVSDKPLVAYAVGKALEGESDVSQGRVESAFRSAVRLLQDHGLLRSGSHEMTSRGRDVLRGVRQEPDYAEAHDRYGWALERIRGESVRERVGRPLLEEIEVEQPADTVREKTMLALIPPDDIRDRMEPYLGPGVERDDLHLTVLYLGELLPHHVKLVRNRLDPATLLLEPLELEPDGAAIFTNEDVDVRVMLYNAPGLDVLRSEMLSAVESTKVPDPPSDHGFIPHVTLGYHDPGEAPDDGWVDVTRPDVEGMGWTASEIHLVRGDEIVTSALLGNRESTRNRFRDPRSGGRGRTHCMGGSFRNNGFESRRRLHEREGRTMKQKGGNHGFQASGMDRAMKKWDKCAKKMSAGRALHGMAKEMGRDRTRNVLRYVTDSHSFNVEDHPDDDEYGLLRKAMKSANWSARQMGDAFVRAAAVDEVEAAMDRVMSRMDRSESEDLPSGTRELVESYVQATMPDRALSEQEQLSDVDVEEGKMKEILGVADDEDVSDAYDGSPQDAAQEVVDAVGEDEAASMINWAANISGSDFLEGMQDALANIGESRRRRRGRRLHEQNEVSPSDFTRVLDRRAISQMVENQAALLNPDITYTGGGMSPNSEVMDAADEIGDALLRSVAEWVSSNQDRVSPRIREMRPQDAAKAMLANRNGYEAVSMVSELGVAGGNPWRDSRTAGDQFFAGEGRETTAAKNDLQDHLRNDNQVSSAASTLKRAVEEQGYAAG